MGQNVNFEDYTPPARFDAVSWTDAQIRERPTPGGAPTVIDTVSLGAADSDPSDPAPRSFTTNAGTAPNLWYDVIFLDGFGNVSEPTRVFHNIAGATAINLTCEDWITGDDVADCCGSTFGTDVPLDLFASEATALLFALSGERFTGVCERTVRPCPGSCGCWGADPLARYIGTSVGGDLFGLDGYWHMGGHRSGCRPLSTVKLAGYPVQEILEVQIDGAVIDPSGYRLEKGRNLVRLADADGNRQRWPGCQRLDLPAGDPGTFTVTYTYGQAPPLPALEAAKQLACQLALACPDPNGGDGECELPAGTVQLIRQGITVNVQTLGLFLTQGQTGLAHVDAFLATYGGRPRRPAVLLSPDVARFAQEA